jgi:hypothetical protein
MSRFHSACLSLLVAGGVCLLGTEPAVACTGITIKPKDG